MHSQLVILFEKFRHECIWLRICYNTHSTLFYSGEETDQILIETAHVFFHDLSRVMQEYCIQRVCVLTDPPVSSGKPNLSVATIDSGLSDLGCFTPEIKSISDALHGYRGLVIEARNKLLSHIDRNTVVSEVSLGGHSLEEAYGFFENLQ